MNEDLMPSRSVWHCDDRERPRGPARGSLVHAVRRLLIASLLLASCAQAPAESRITADVIMLDRLNIEWITGNRTGARLLIAQPLADAQSRVSPSAATLLASNNGVSLFSFIVSCALPADATLLATVGNDELEFFGEFGLAPQWRSAPVDLAGQRWVSACLLARVNAHSVAVPFSARGPNLGLAASDDERAAVTLEEGAFYGNIFVPLDQRMQSFACRGKDQAKGESGGLAERDCAEPDPAKPGLTQCGFTFAGDCGSFAANPTCESFSSVGTYYRRCHTAPIQAGPSDVFEQVITAFAFP
jgi:hypothetical protein